MLQYIFENSTVNISALCRLSECIFTFPYAADNNHSCILEVVRNRTHEHIPFLLGHSVYLMIVKLNVK
jgi:hypothetical protein